MSYAPELHAVLAAFGKATMRAMELERTISDLESEIDRLRYENHTLREIAHDQIETARQTPPVDEFEPEGELMPQEPKIVEPLKKGNPPLRL